MNLPVLYDKVSWQERIRIREEYIRRQEGNCMYCKSPLDKSPPSYIINKKINWDRFPPNFLKYPVHLQHDRKTGLTEGAVHNYCNAVLWCYHRR